LRGQCYRAVSDLMANILTCIFAVALCLLNALIWTFISNMPIVGVCWVGAATLCYRLQKWSKG
jgi:hypothetical protein